MWGWVSVMVGMVRVKGSVVEVVTVGTVVTVAVEGSLGAVGPLPTPAAFGWPRWPPAGWRRWPWLRSGPRSACGVSGVGSRRLLWWGRRRGRLQLAAQVAVLAVGREGAVGRLHPLARVEVVGSWVAVGGRRWRTAAVVRRAPAGGGAAPGMVVQAAPARGEAAPGRRGACAGGRCRAVSEGGGLHSGGSRRSAVPKRRRRCVDGLPIEGIGAVGGRDGGPAVLPGGVSGSRSAGRGGGEGLLAEGIGRREAGADLFF